MCLTSCTKECEGVHWKLENRPYIGHESKRINSSHTVLTLRNFTYPMAMLECRRRKTDSVIGGTIIRTYSNGYSSSFQLLGVMSLRMTHYLNVYCSFFPAAKPNKLACILHYKNPLMAMPDLLTCKWEDQTSYSHLVNYTVLW